MSSAAPAASTAPSPPRAPRIEIEVGAIVLDGESLDPTGDVAGRVTSRISGRPLVAGESLRIAVQRAAKPKAVVGVMIALGRAKAKNATFVTEDRARKPLELRVSLPPSNLAPCTPIAYLGQKGAVSVWDVGGSGAAKRFDRGLAGPEIWLAAEVAREHSAKCDSSYVVVGGDDSLSFGLVADMAQAAQSSADGSPTKVTDAILTDNATPGRKVVFPE